MGEGKSNESKKSESESVKEVRGKQRVWMIMTRRGREECQGREQNERMEGKGELKEGKKEIEKTGLCVG